MAIETQYMSANGPGEISDGEADWTDVVQAVHMRLLQEMDLAAVEKLEPARAHEAVASAARQLVQSRARDKDIVRRAIKYAEDHLKTVRRILTEK